MISCIPNKNIKPQNIMTEVNLNLLKMMIKIKMIYHNQKIKRKKKLIHPKIKIINNKIKKTDHNYQNQMKKEAIDNDL